MSSYGRKNDEFPVGWLILGAVLIVLFLCTGVGGCMYGYPHYKVYERRLSGEAVLREAEFSRQVEVEAAKAKLESAKLHAESEVIRAEGVAKANEIVAKAWEVQKAISDTCGFKVCRTAAVRSSTFRLRPGYQSWKLAKDNLTFACIES